MDNIKVSVIVPVYNCSEYISTTLNSIINQDFDSYEMIVIDDGSSDNSLDIIYDTLKQTDIPHKIIHQRNMGVSVARNHGMEVARGEYFVFVDGDDYILTTHLSELYKNINEFSLVQFVKKEGNTISNPHFLHEKLMATDEFIKKELMMEITVNLWQIMYKADIIKDNNLKFTPGVIYGEDTEFALKTLSFGDKIAISNEITYYYIQHESSTINTSSFKRFEFIQILENLAEFFKKQDKNDLARLIITSRIPKAIFGNMNYFFYNDYDFNEVISKMDELDLFKKLSEYDGNKKFKIKIKLFLFNPKLYYKMWKKFKNSI